MVKTGDLNWEGGEAHAEAYQARWKQPEPRSEKRTMASPTEFDGAREVDADGRTVTFRYRTRKLYRPGHRWRLRAV